MNRRLLTGRNERQNNKTKQRGCGGGLIATLITCSEKKVNAALVEL